MTLPIIFLPEVQSEFDDAIDWYEQQKAGLGAAFLAAVRNVKWRGLPPSARRTRDHRRNRGKVGKEKAPPRPRAFHSGSHRIFPCTAWLVCS